MLLHLSVQHCMCPWSSVCSEWESRVCIALREVTGMAKLCGCSIEKKPLMLDACVGCALYIIGVSIWYAVMLVLDHATCCQVMVLCACLGLQ